VMLGEAAPAKSVQEASGPSTKTVWGKVASWQIKNASAAGRVLQLGKITDGPVAAKLHTTTPVASGTSQSAANVKEKTMLSAAPMQAASWQVKKESDVSSRGKSLKHPPTRSNVSDAPAATSLTTTLTIASSTSTFDREPQSSAKPKLVKRATDEHNQSHVALQTVSQAHSWQVKKNFTQAQSNGSHEAVAPPPSATTTTAVLTSMPKPTTATSTQAQGAHLKEADRHADSLAMKKAPLAPSTVNKTAAKQNNTGRLGHKQKGRVTPQSHSNASAADDNTSGTAEYNSSNASGNPTQLQYCRLANHTREKHLVGSGADSLEEKAPKGSYAAGTIAVVCCAEGYGGSRTSWELKCEANGRWKAQHWKGQKNTSLPDCRPVNCSTPHDPLGTWHVHGIFNESVQLVCAKGFVPDSGSPVIPCIGRTAQPARCVPGRGSAEKWRNALQRDALLRLLGAVAVVAVVLVLCVHDPLARLGAQQMATTTDDGHTGLGDRLVEPSSQQAIGLPQGNGLYSLS